MAGALGVDQPGSSPRCSSLGSVLAGWAARCSSRASRRKLSSTCRDHRRRLRGHGGRRAGQYRRRLPGRAADRRDQGLLHRPRHVTLFGFEISLLQAHAGGGVPRHGGGAGRAAVWGLLGKPQCRAVRARSNRRPRLAQAEVLAFALACSCARALPLFTDRYTLILLTDIVCFALFSVSCIFIMGPGGMHSFGHAAYFGLGAYGAGLLAESFGLPMEAALPWRRCAPAICSRIVFGWFCVRLSGVYLAMLTLAFAQISWSIVFQWDSVTGGSNGVVGIWPSAWLADKTAYYYLALVLCGPACLALWRVLYLALRLRAARRPRFAIARRSHRHRRAHAAVGGFVLVGALAGLAGASTPSPRAAISPEHLDRRSRSTASSWCCWAASRPHRPGGRRGDLLPGCATSWRARYRLLARRAGRRDPAARAAFPQGLAGRRLKALGARRAGAADMNQARSARSREEPAQDLRRRAGGGRRVLRRVGRRDCWP
jgi:ABC-type branched-subunit amino acid transport system permease subunit